eukprot:GSChrysophyteH1.ASY1.ANO1.219.1 assembled CDS
MSKTYNLAMMKRPQAVADLGRECSSLFHNFGVDFTRKNNLCQIEQNVIIYALGNAVIFENFVEKTKKYLLGLDDGGVGCIVVHPSKKMFAVGGRGHQPNIYIYSYPDLQIKNVLKGGAERGYSCLSYNAHGTKLASVATSPDFMLTVWDWEKELIELHSKAKDDDARLTTSGTGHIRFWKMASTFTGLKLQGHIGKFGKVELSDCRFVQVGGNPCHTANVTYVELDRQEKCVISASDDGWIRWWDFNAIDLAEVDADITLDYELLPVAEHYLGDGHGVRSMIDCGVDGLYRRFFILDSMGIFEGSVSRSILAYTEAGNFSDENEAKPAASHVADYHSGPITGLACLPGLYLAVSSGEDKTVRLWDIANKELLATRRFDAAATSLSLVPTALNHDLEKDAKHGFSIMQKAVLKPHGSAVNAISFSDDNNMMVTSGMDGQIFLFRTGTLPLKEGQDVWTPLRLMSIAPGIASKSPIYAEKISWKSDGNCLLLSCTDGVLREVDVSSCYAMTVECDSYEHQFPVKDFYGQIAHKIEAKKPVDVVEEEGSQAEDGDSEKEQIEYLTLKVSSAMYKLNEPESFYAGAISKKPAQDCTQEHSFGLYAGDGKAQMKTPVPTCMSYSQSKKFLGLGTASGHNGAVNHVSMSFDDKFVVSAGIDGVVVVHTVDTELIANSAEDLWKNIDAGVYGAETVKREDRPDADAEKSGSEAAAELVEGPGAYTIQDAKLKSEEDAKMLTAEEVKEKQRALVKNLQREYEQIVHTNNAMPDSIRLNAEEMTIDNDVFDKIRADGLVEIDEVHKERRREAERSAKLRDKVILSLMDNLLVDKTTLSAFHNGNSRQGECIVKSLRCQGLPRTIVELISAAEENIKEMVASENASIAQSQNDESKRIKPVNMQHMLDDGAASIGGSATVDELDKHAASAAARREARKIRKDNIQKHKLEEPKDDEDDERDLQAIDLAQRTIGDYKLKVSPEYEVPPDQHVDAGKKKLQMSLLEESMVKMRLGFNERFLNLRDLKKELVNGIRRSNKRVREIDEELGQSHLSENLWQPILDPSEYPEDRDRVTKADLDEYVENLKKSKGKNKWASTQPTSYQDLTLNLVDQKDMEETQRFISSSRKEEVNDAPLKSYTLDADESVTEHAQAVEVAVPLLARIQRARKQITRIEETAEAQREERKRRLRFERQWLLDNIDENVAAFREAIDNLRVDRHAILADLKLAELKLLSLFQEYTILQGFEARDNMLLEKQRRSSKDLATIELEVSDQQATLETKEGDKKLLLEEATKILAEFEVMLPTSNAYYDQLRKIYRKKVKRGGAGDEDEDDDEDLEEEDEEEEEEDDEEVDDVCPPGCDPGLHERILELRDRKLTNDEQTATLQKQIDDTKRAYERLRTRLKQVAKDVKQSAVEIQSFQLQKQGSLNHIDVALPLSMNQIYMFEMNGAFTAGMNDFCLVHGNALTGLSERIGGLRSETEEARKQYGELRKERVVLSRLRDTQQEKISSWKSRVRDLQMLKFGREIDLDDLEAGSNRSREEEAERGLKEQEDRTASTVYKLTREGERLREKLAKAMVSNTELLRHVGDLTEQKLTITRDLNAPGNNVSTESKDEGRSEREERQKVIAYVQLQAREIEALRAELIMLKRKEAPQMSQIIGQQTLTNPPGAPGGSSATPYEGQLPPIPGAQNTNQMNRTNQR